MRYGSPFLIRIPEEETQIKGLLLPGFLIPIAQFLKNKGIIHLKTDNTELFNYTKTVVI